MRTAWYRFSILSEVWTRWPRFVSNTAMEQDLKTDDTTDRRLTELEIKASFTEDLLDKLDQVIVRQQQQIDLLIREVTLLRQPAAESGGSRTTVDARDELPPHY